jgi:hypothetical protein
MPQILKLKFISFYNLLNKCIFMSRSAGGSICGCMPFLTKLEISKCKK